MFARFVKICLGLLAISGIFILLAILFPAGKETFGTLAEWSAILVLALVIVVAVKHRE